MHIMLTTLRPHQIVQWEAILVAKKNEEQAVMIVGRDEATFKQFLLNTKMWTGSLKLDGMMHMKSSTLIQV